MPTIGHIGRYALKYQLGSGGLGTVFAAHDPLLSRLIAVKTLNLEIKDEERESFNALFINEARAAGGLSHPHIVTVFDAGISDNRAYIAMELLKGRDLRQLRQEGWRATPAQAALIVRRVADALAFAHSKGVIHRDIKPANIFMVGRTQPRVLDFGIARVAHRRESGEALTGAGSPYYMAPEQVRCEPADRRADVFSLGVVLYELLTDTKPFAGETLQQITHAVLNIDPPLASKVDKSVPRALAEIASRAMAKDPEQRFRSARSLARELRQWLDANPAGPESDAGLPAKAATATRRRLGLRIASAAIAVAIAGLLAGGIWWQNSASRERAAAVSLPTPPPRSSVAVPASRAALPAPAATPSSPSALPTTAVATSASGLANPSLPTSTPADRAAALPAPAPTSSATSAQDSLLLASIVPITPATTVRHSAPAAETVPAAAPTTTLHRSETAPNAGPSNGTSAAKESSKDRRVREARERDARLAAAVPAAVITGTVRIAISPWGQVEVDGAASGAAPPLTELTLSEGRHQIVVRNGEYAPFVATINVVAGQPVSLKHRFGT